MIESKPILCAASIITFTGEKFHLQSIAGKEYSVKRAFQMYVVKNHELNHSMQNPNFANEEYCYGEMTKYENGERRFTMNFQMAEMLMGLCVGVNAMDYTPATRETSAVRFDTIVNFFYRKMYNVKFMDFEDLMTTIFRTVSKIKNLYDLPTTPNEFNKP